MDYTFTSPPYNRKRDDKYALYRDTKQDYYGFLKEIIDKCLEHSRYVFFNLQKNYYNKADVFRIFGEYSDRIIDAICWAKSNPLPASGHNITNSYEFILILSNTERSIKSNTTYTKNFIETAVYSENPYKKIHRAVMKPEVAEWFVEKFTKPDETILDPFMGLGTTGIEAKKHGRNFIGIELNPTYYEIAKERIDEVMRPD